MFQDSAGGTPIEVVVLYACPAAPVRRPIRVHPRHLYSPAGGSGLAVTRCFSIREAARRRGPLPATALSRRRGARTTRVRSWSA